MHIRETSFESFRRVRNSGLLSVRRLETYEMLYVNGPSTGGKLMAVAKKLDPSRSLQYLESMGKRLSELRDQGAVEEAGTKICSQTGMRCIVWVVTGNMPTKAAKRISSNQKIRILENIIENLKAEIKEKDLKISQFYGDF